jgi:hypothetical protein
VGGHRHVTLPFQTTVEMSSHMLHNILLLPPGSTVLLPPPVLPAPWKPPPRKRGEKPRTPPPPPSNMISLCAANGCRVRCPLELLNDKPLMVMVGPGVYLRGPESHPKKAPTVTPVDFLGMDEVLSLSSG